MITNLIYASIKDFIKYKNKHFYFPVYLFYLSLIAVNKQIISDQRKIYNFGIGPSRVSFYKNLLHLQIIYFFDYILLTR